MDSKKILNYIRMAKKWCCVAITTFALEIGLIFMNSTTVVGDSP